MVRRYFCCPLESYLWLWPKATRAPFLICVKSDAASGLQSSAAEDSLGAKHRGAKGLEAAYCGTLYCCTEYHGTVAEAPFVGFTQSQLGLHSGVKSRFEALKTCTLQPARSACFSLREAGLDRASPLPALFSSSAPAGFSKMHRNCMNKHSRLNVSYICCAWIRLLELAQG